MRLFPQDKILLDSPADYRYRTFVPRAQLRAVPCREILAIDHLHVKDSVHDSETKALYKAIWERALE